MSTEKPADPRWTHRTRAPNLEPETPCFLLCPSPEARGLYSDIQVAGGWQRNAGTDLRFPADAAIPPTASIGGRPVVVDLGVRARCAVGERFVAYQIVPRSSISATPLGLANSVGTIDRGYTGSLKVAIRNHSDEAFVVVRGTSLFQLVHPSLEPAHMGVVSDDDPAFAEGASLRGAGAFGSTGPGGAEK
jgi:dUTPase